MIEIHKPTGQTADFMQWQTSNGEVIMRFAADGKRVHRVGCPGDAEHRQCDVPPGTPWEDER